MGRRVLKQVLIVVVATSAFLIGGLIGSILGAPQVPYCSHVPQILCLSK